MWEEGGLDCGFLYFGEGPLPLQAEQSPCCWGQLLAEGLRSYSNAILGHQWKCILWLPHSPYSAAVRWGRVQQPLPSGGQSRRERCRLGRLYAGRAGQGGMPARHLLMLRLAHTGAVTSSWT